MADRYSGTGQLKKPPPPRPTTAGDGGPPFRRIRQPHPPKSTQLIGIMALLISTGILLILAGITISAAVIGLIFIAPIVIITSPIWVLVGILLFFAVAGVLSLCGLGLAAAAAVAWLFKYL